METKIKAKIYRINNDVDDLFYIGSTTQTLARRFGGHKSKAISNPDLKFYSHMNNLGFGCFRIILIENIEVDNKDEIKKKEDEYIRLLKPSLNSYNAVAILDKDKKNEYNKNYYILNKQDLDRKNNSYREIHLKELNEYSKLYRELNHDMLNEHIDCDCGGKYSKKQKARHMKSQKHLKYCENNI